MTNTFYEIANLYDSIKPLVSKDHPKEQDLRPIGKRRMKWERIERINKHTYCLWAGYMDGDDIFAARDKIKFSNKEKIMSAAIVWQRKRGGVQRIKVRNCHYGYATGYYKFLKTYLPDGLEFVIRSGTHYVVPCSGKFKGEAYLLQHPERITEPYAKTLSPHAMVCRGVSPTGEDHYLEFDLQPDGSFHPVGKTKDTRLRIARRVDMERKARLKPDIEALWEWFTSIAPMTTPDPADFYYKKRHAMNAYKEKFGYYPQNFSMPNAQREEVIQQDNIEGYMWMLCWLTENLTTRVRIGSGFPYTYETRWMEPKKMRATYNRVMNKYLNLEKKEVVNADAQ